MKNTRTIHSVILIILLMALSGCAATVRTAPPPARVEVRPAVPFRGAIWIDGHYAYRHSKYIWVPGRYAKPPRVGAHWVPGHWKQQRRGWRWVPGHWK